MLTEILMTSLMLVNTHFKTDSVINIKEVTVTEFKANRRSLAPLSANKMNARDLDLQNVTSMKELSTLIPNFYMPDYGSRANSPIFIRGIGSKAKTSAVGFYIDGIPHYDISALDVDMADIASIEVLRGPQGTLYGRNAMGGIIDIHTFSPLEYQNTKIKIGYGNKNDITAQASSYLKLADNLGFSIAGNYHSNDGFFTNVATGKKADKIKEYSGRTAFEWKPTEFWKFRFSSWIDYSNQNGYPYALYNKQDNTIGDISYNRTSGFKRLISNNGLSAVYNGSNISFSSQTSYQFMNGSMNIDQDFTTADKYFVTNDYHMNTLTQEFTLKSNNDKRYQWILGAFGLIQKKDNVLITDYIAQKFSMPTYYNDPISSFALYHQSSYNIWKGLSATVGLRFDYEHAKKDYKRYTIATGSTSANNSPYTFNNNLNFNQFSPKFSLQYLTTLHNNYYVTVSRGYKVGGFNETITSDDNKTYQPEYSWNYEVGSKLSFLDGKITTDISLFYIDWRHQQITHTIPGVGNILTNAGHSNSKGVELSVSAHPIYNWNVGLSYGYTYAEFLDYKQSDNINYNHNMIPMVPRNTFGMNSDYTLYPKCNIVDRITFSAGLNGTGKIYWDESNSLSQKFYLLLNAKVIISSGKLNWEIWGKNLTNTDYQAYCFSLSNAYYVQKGKPVSFGTSITYNF